jgi:large subunit ribosomal protein L4
VKTALFDAGGKKLKNIDLNPSVFGIEAKASVVHQVVKAQLAGARSGTADTKTRAEVRGGGRKPWRQKGTGRARAGSIRSPLWKGGGTVFGPTPRSYAQKVPKKLSKLALRSILSDKAKSGSLAVIDRFGFDRPETKAAEKVFSDLKLDGKITVVVGNEDLTAVKSIRNLPKARAILICELNPYDLVDCDHLVVTKEALDRMTEVLSVVER